VARDVAALVGSLTLEEKATLLSGADLWSTAAITRSDIRTVFVTDGPNGARGPQLPGVGGATSWCAPCGSALGASWNVDLVERVGRTIGAEARTKAARVLLGPTVNIHRSPLAGRNFECYSEDPLLSGKTAAAFVRGVQSRGVATTVKHFAANDAETERMTMNSVVDERTLREITLLPFEVAVREGGALGIMTAYNRLNGVYCGEHEWLLADVLRGEWDFEGFVLSDWYARLSTVGSITAGLDLEMPGPPRVYGDLLVKAVETGEVDEKLVDAAATRLLGVFDRLGALDDEPAEPRSVDRPEDRALAREAAAEAMVLLKNDDVLPLDLSSLRTLAVVGPNAESARIMGGGSASFVPHSSVPPLEALQARLGDVRIVFEQGCDIEKTVPPVQATFDVEVEGAEQREQRADGSLLFFGGMRGEGASFRATAALDVDIAGPHVLSLVQVGRARVLLDGDLVLDGVTDPPPTGDGIFGAGSVPIERTVDLEAGPHELVVEYTGARGMLEGVQLGCRALPPADLLDRAVAAAADADAALVVVGTNSDWESEGHDRTTMDLPGDQAELIRRVAAVNPRTVVAVNAASPVTTDWAAEVAAVLVTWFGGQEMANALADVLVGDAEPGGRLPTTFPQRLEHNPSFGNFPGEDGQVRYGEGVLVGYRWYETRRLPVAFPFGHGLSYTTFAIGEPRCSDAAFTPGGTLTVTVDVTNTGTRRGNEVVQCYIAPQDARVTRPVKELKAFAKVALDPGEARALSFELDDRAFAYWMPALDEPEAGPVPPPIPLPLPPPDRVAREPGWRVDPGRYELHIGRSSADIAHVVTVEVPA
jgi:beta-glucosidase